MSIEVYWVSGSPFSWMVLLGLEIKGLAYQSKLLEVSKGETKTESFLKLNPRGQVPVLKDGDIVIYESLAILAYLDRQYPKKPLFGTTSAEHGYIWQCTLEQLNHSMKPIFKVIWPLWRGEAKDKSDDIKQASDECHAVLAQLDEKLMQKPYIAGNEISAADIAIFPTLQCLINAASQNDAASLKLNLLPFSTTYPHIAAWQERIEAIPGYKRTFRPHW